MEQRVSALEHKWSRMEQHQTELKKDIASLRDGMKEITMLLGGSALNGNKGFIKLMEVVETKVDVIEKSIDSHEKDINQVTWVGRIVAGATIGMILKEIFYK